jgi:hypothetical protein
MSHYTVGERAVELLVENGYCQRDELEGCTEQELETLEQRYDVTLPEAYKSCMRQIGKYAGGLLAGSHFAYPGIRRQTEFAKQRAEKRETDFEFSDDAFVFHALQGYMFDYFNAESEEDPPVYVFTKFEGEYGSRRRADSFSTWLFKEIERSSSRV